MEWATLAFEAWAAANTKTIFLRGLKGALGNILRLVCTQARLPVRAILAPGTEGRDRRRSEPELLIQAIERFVALLRLSLAVQCASMLPGFGLAHEIEAAQRFTDAGIEQAASTFEAH